MSTTRTALDAAGALAREDLSRGKGGLAVLRYVHALGEYYIHTWTDDEIVVAARDHEPVTLTWLPPWAPSPRFRVVDKDGLTHTFNTPFGAGTYISTRRDITAPALSYLITVNRPGRMPETEPYEVVGLDAALDQFTEECTLTNDGAVPVHSGAWRDGVASSLRHGRGKVTMHYETPDGVLYIHTLERMH